MRLTRSLTLAAICFASAACAHAPDEQSPAGPVAAPAQPITAGSLDPRLKFKDGARLQRQLATAFNLPLEEICKELSTYDCNDQAFLITLGGMEPQRMLAYVPLEEAALAAPIAVDRVVMHACVKRVDMDFANPQTALLTPVASKAPRPDRSWRRATVQRVYDALIGREPSKVETDELVAAYEDLARGRPAADAARDWSVLTCFAVGTSVENLFY